ncbi:class I adenylate-forming enzyme family protein [Rhizorhabdus wittichii]|uniref:class I adenylate-forming enzyme family protein n=1 Tax=Rhizorhabdus wittichii TaxID=160791 RepID=UPI0002E7F3FC|nr:fatty acid--CoA ligase family protein [Rhizorhabdus wittichii]
MAIAEHIQAVARAGGRRVAIDFRGRTISWNGLGEAIVGVTALLADRGVSPDAAIGLLGRNRLEQMAAFVALLGAGRSVVLINAIRPAGLVAEEVEELELACLLASDDDLASEIVAAAERVGTLAIGMAVEGDALALHPRAAAAGEGPFRTRQPGVLIEIQTSGTTGKPKRIPVQEHTVEASLRDGVRKAKGAIEQGEITPKASPTLMFMPLVHTSGTFNTLMSVFECRPIVLFEKFDADEYRQALVTYRPKFAPLPPTAIKMMVDSDATREDFASVMAVRAGTAPLPVDLQQAFEDKFGVPVLTTYGATEFLGVVTSWTLDDYRNFGRAKRGSVGRPSKGVAIRIVDPVDGNELPAGETGLLEARLARIDGGREWIRTTDLARLDDDGFLYILGRADDAIIRGGFKVMADKVADIVRTYPGIYDVIVLGRPDGRLGEVPVAVIEPYPGRDPLDAAAIRQFARERLTPYEVPAQFHVVDRLPRTVSDKVSRPDVVRLLEGLGS